MTKIIYSDEFYHFTSLLSKNAHEMIKYLPAACKFLCLIGLRLPAITVYATRQ